MAGFSFQSIPSSIRWVIGILALLIIIGLWRVFGPTGKAQGEGNRPPLVRVMTATPERIEEFVTVTGAIAARDEVGISAEENARVASLHAEIGDVVKQGEVLARLDTSMIAPQVASLEATLEEARANAAVAAADYRRALAVAEIGALSAQEVERRGSAAVAAQSRVTVVSSQLREAQARLRRTEIRAPFDGIVLTRTAEVGQYAGPGGAALFRVGRAEAIEMRGNVAEQDLPRLTLGQGAEVTVTGVAQSFVGTVRLIGAVIDAQSRLGSVRIELPAHKDLRPGAFARGRIAVAAEARLLVPQTAVMTDPEGNFVYVVGANDRVERREVEVSDARAEGLVIGRGLRAGDRIVVTAGPYLQANEVVRVAQ
jgi:RND family efflux transporter MFP subunit